MSRKWRKGKRKREGKPAIGLGPEDAPADEVPKNGQINGQHHDKSNGKLMPQTPSGPLGNGYLQPGKADMVLARRAIRNGWNVQKETKDKIVAQMEHVLANSQDERNRIAASKVLLEADKTDQAFQIEAERKPAEVLINGSIKHDHNHIHRISIDEFRQLPLEQRLRILRGPDPLPIEDRATQSDAV